MMKTAAGAKAKLRNLLSDAISLLCRTNLGLINTTFSIEAFIGINVNDDEDEDVMLLSFKETYMPDGAAVAYVWQKQGSDSRELVVNDGIPTDPHLNIQPTSINSFRRNSSDNQEKQTAFEVKKEFNSDPSDNDADVLIVEDLGNKQKLGTSNLNRSTFQYSNYNSCTSSPDSATLSPLSINQNNKRRKQKAPSKFCYKNNSDDVNESGNKSSMGPKKFDLVKNSDNFCNDNNEDDGDFCLNLKIESIDSSEPSKHSQPINFTNLEMPCLNGDGNDEGGCDDAFGDRYVVGDVVKSEVSVEKVDSDDVEDSKNLFCIVPYTNYNNNNSFEDDVCSNALTYSSSSSNNNNIKSFKRAGNNNAIKKLVRDNNNNNNGSNRNAQQPRNKNSNRGVSRRQWSSSLLQSNKNLLMTLMSSSSPATTSTSLPEQPQNYTLEALNSIRTTLLSTTATPAAVDNSASPVSLIAGPQVSAKKRCAGVHFNGRDGVRKRKSSSSNLNRNSYEHDAKIISDLLPYLFDQHRPILIPPTVTQFAPKKRCRVCYSKKLRKEVRYCCVGCVDHPGLCLEPCFYQFHFVRGCVLPKLGTEIRTGDEEENNNNDNNADDDDNNNCNNVNFGYSNNSGNNNYGDGDGGDANIYNDESEM